MSRTPESQRGSNSLTSMYKRLKSSRVYEFPKLREGRTVFLRSRPSTLISRVSGQKNTQKHQYTPADRFLIFRRNRYARSFILRKYIDRFLARRSEGVISVMNFNHWTGGWDPTANPVKSMMMSYGLSTRCGSIIVCWTCQQLRCSTRGLRTLRT